jgi:hypothetical protein
VDDKPGGLADILQLIEESKINIEYMYAFTARRGNRAVLIFRFDNPDGAVTLLQSKGRNVLGSIELFER